MNQIRRAALVVALVPACFALTAAERPVTSSGIDHEGFDKSVRPQDDLFRHVNGGWISSTEIPAERSYYGSFIQLAEKAESDLRAIIEEAARTGGPEGSEAQKVGDLYASFMDDKAAETNGIEPIKAELERVEAIGDKSAFLGALGSLQREGVSGLFGLYIDTDAKRSDRYIPYLNQGGLGLPDESYYRDPKFEKVREAYVAHVAKMFELAGRPDPKGSARDVMALETRLAKSHWDRVKSRDDTLTYNKKDVEGLTKLTPGFDWAAWVDGAKAPHADEVIVRQPEYFSAMAQALDEVPIDHWKRWLTWNVLRAHAPLLSTPFVEENFAFYGKTLTGAQEIRPRWKRGVSVVEAALGEAVGKLYVARHFPPAAAARMRDLVKNLVAAYREDIETLDWMSPETREKAIEKLEKFTPKIGHPATWRDYSALTIKRGDLVGNVRRAEAFEFDRQLNKLGKPVDRGEWLMTPQTVNAYYNPGMNEIVFPAAILQPPFFDMNA
ncbi:MAG: M13 family metallopeptidase, partial [Isosphaeraceae bacterium]